MCGIIGLINKEFATNSSLPIETLHHRGPDDRGIYKDPFVSLGHTRLAIQDPSSNAHQPMISNDDNYVIIYNGEIYNHLELRKELSKKYIFRSESDTETLLYGYIEYGENVLNLLNGIFSFAIYHKSDGNLFIARDHFGIKPLYYYHTDDSFIFGSEIKSFTELSFFDKSISHNSIYNYLTLLYSPGELTPFEKVKKLLPAHYIKINVQKPEEIIIKKYYELKNYYSTHSNNSEKDFEKELEERLLKTIERQMLSDVPIGFFLSGGLDSSALVALAKAIYPEKKFQCFTTNLGEDKNIEGFCNDLHYARRVAKHLNVDLEEVKIDINVLKDFDFMIYHLDEPISDPAALLTYNISKRSKELGYKVLISGTGGDEVFSGYRRHQAIRLENLYQYAPQFLLDTLYKSLSVLQATNLIRRRGEKLLRYSKKDKFERIASYFFWLEPAAARELFSPNVKDRLEGFNPKNYFYQLLNNAPKEWDDLNRILYLDIMSYLPYNNLTYTDKMSMAAGVEVRVPFLDKELVEFASSIPSELKMKGTTTKYLLRKVMKKYLPEEIINRSKTGFGVPSKKWVTTYLDEKINFELSAIKIKNRGIFNPNTVEKLINDNKINKTDASYPIWALLALESWIAQFIDSK